MIANITILTYGRPRLLEQALKTLKDNTAAESYRLSLFDDEGKFGTGGARNHVIEMAETTRGDYLYLSDNDVAFTPDWLTVLVAAYEHAHGHLDVRALGGCCHPYHQPYAKIQFGGREIGLTLALPTQSMLMRWETWDRYGPFVSTPPGRVGMSEDWMFTENLRADGFRVGAIYPHLVINTGRHDSFGKLMVGHELVQDVEGLIVE